jgi:hypothetical protein
LPFVAIAKDYDILAVMRVRKYALRVILIAMALLAAAPRVTHAQTDEIQVYDASIADVGKFNLTWHNNFTPDGLTTPAFPGAIIADKSFNGVTEWAYGVTPWFEAGLYLPLYSISKNHDVTINGGKIRMLFVSPDAADRTFFFGVNFEFSYNATYWEPERFTSEIRPIFGWHLHPWDIIINPILDNSFRGGFKSLDFAPCARIAYNFTPKFALAVEEYSDVGPLRAVLPTSQESHEVWGVLDRGTKIGNFEVGVGFGVTPASNAVTLKLIWSRDLN